MVPDPQGRVWLGILRETHPCSQPGARGEGQRLHTPPRTRSREEKRERAPRGGREGEREGRRGWGGVVARGKEGEGATGKAVLVAKLPQYTATPMKISYCKRVGPRTVPHSNYRGEWILKEIKVFSAMRAQTVTYLYHIIGT
jgi:hypothetical protein